MKHKQALRQTLSFAVITIAVFLTAISCASVTRHEDDGHIGAVLNLSGVMWTTSFDEENNIVWEQINEDMTVTSNVGGSGSYIDGQLVFSIGSPSDKQSIASFIPFCEENGYYRFLGEGLFFRNMNISAPETMMSVLHYLTTPAGEFSRQYTVIRRCAADNELDYVVYVYVDRDVTITADGTRHDSGYETLFTKYLDITLGAGWNALHLHLSQNNAEFALSIRLDDPLRMRWLTGEAHLRFVEEH